MTDAERKETVALPADQDRPGRREDSRRRDRRSLSLAGGRRQPGRQGVDRKGKRLHAIRPRQTARPRQDSRPPQRVARHRQPEYAGAGQGEILLHEARRQTESADPLRPRRACTARIASCSTRTRWTRKARRPSIGGFPRATARCWPTAFRPTAANNRRCISAMWRAARTCRIVIERTRLLFAGLAAGRQGLLLHALSGRRQRAQGRGELSPPRLLPHARRRPGKGPQSLRRGPGGGGHAGRRAVARRPLARRHGGARLGQDGGLLRRLERPRTTRKVRRSSRWSRRWTRPSA